MNLLDLLRVPEPATEPKRTAVVLSDTDKENIAKANERIATLNGVLRGDEWEFSDDHKTKAREHLVAVRRYIQCVQAGLEPTSPPKQWYAGFVREIPQDIQRQRNWTDTWPNAFAGDRWSMSARVQHVFDAPIPKSAMTAYQKYRGLFGVDDIRVYSPHESDFRKIPQPLPEDPVIIGRVHYSPHGSEKVSYFEIARWDFSKDLISLYASLGG